MFHYAAPEMVWDRGDIEHKINEMPTIDAIPVEWLQEKRDIAIWQFAGAIDWLLSEWQKEVDAQSEP